MRIGVDIVDVGRLEEVMSSSPGWAERVFTPAELEYASRRPRPAEHLAARFAAKEATFKALGEGWPSLRWKDVEVVSHNGRPELRITGDAAETAGCADASVSLSHDGGMAIAYVVLSRTTRPPVWEDTDV